MTVMVAGLISLIINVGLLTLYFIYRKNGILKEEMFKSPINGSYWESSPLRYELGLGHWEVLLIGYKKKLKILLKNY